MEKVLSWAVCLLASATITEESIPPLRNAPKGTSDIILSCTEDIYPLYQLLLCLIVSVLFI